MKQRHVFVYGTLKQGFGNHPVIREGVSSSLLGSHTLPGYKMKSVSGFFPAIRPAEGHEVTGELYVITDDQVMVGLDRLEGYRATDEEHSMYLRRSVDPSLFGLDPETTLVDTYIWRDDEEFELMAEVADGTWH